MSDVSVGDEGESSGFEPYSFKEYIAEQRKWLFIDRDILLEQRQEIDDKLAEIECEFAAIDAYEAAKIGETQKPGLTRVRRGSRREDMLTLLSHRSPLTRSDILEYLGAKGDRARENSVSNILSRMKKDGEVIHEDGQYYLPQTALQAAE